MSEQQPAVWIVDGKIITQWPLTWWERLKILLRGSVYLCVSELDGPQDSPTLTLNEPNVPRIVWQGTDEDSVGQAIVE